MRIVYVSYMHPAIVAGGVEQLALQLFEASQRQGHHAYFIAAPEENHGRLPAKPIRRSCRWPVRNDNASISRRATTI